MKYILPSPEQYTRGLYREFVIAQLEGEDQKAERLHAQMQEFVHAMGRIESYHQNRSKE